jgi:hypothetical protein
MSLFLAAVFLLIAALPAAAVELNLEAEIAKGAKSAVKQPVEWTVSRMFNDKNPGEVVASSREPAPKFALEPGHYLVTAKLGLAKAEQTVELTKVAVLTRLNLNAGIVRLSMIPHAGAPVIKDPVRWELFRYSKGGGMTERVAEANAPATEFILPAGGWVARASYEGTLSELVIPLEAGQTFNYTLNLYAGKAKVAATGPGGGAFKDPVMWEVVRASDRNDLVTATTAPAPQFTLREGKYIVLARQGTFAGEAPLEVKAGKTASAKVKMDTITPEQSASLEAAAKKRVELAQAALAPKPAAAPKTATQVASTGATRTLADTLKTADAAQKAAGQTVSAQVPGTAPAAATIAAPAPQAVAAVPPAPAPAAAAGDQAQGSAAVSAVGKSGKAFKDPVLYEIVTAADQNRLVAEATAPKHQFALPAGRYIVLARQGAYAGAAALDVKAGQSASADVPMSKVSTEQVAALEAASKKRAEMKALAAQAPAAQVAAAPAPAATTPPAPQPAPAGAAEALTAADAVPQAAPVSFEASSTRSLAETMAMAEAAQKAAKGEAVEASTEGAAAASEAASAPAAEAVAAATGAAGADATAAATAAATPQAQVAAASASMPAETTATAAAEPATEAAPAADQPDGSVKVTAWSKNVETFRDAVEWEIRRVQPSGAVLPELVASHKAAKHEFALPAGTYVIWGRQGTLIGKQRFEVEPSGTVAIRVFMQTPTVAADAPGATASEEVKPASSGG